MRRFWIQYACQATGRVKAIEVSAVSEHDLYKHIPKDHRLINWGEIQTGLAF